MTPDGLERALSRGADVGVDPFFTARVLCALPPRPLGASLSPWRRLAVLVAAYGFAGVVGYAALGDGQSATMSGAAVAIADVVDRSDLDAMSWGGVPWGGAVALPLSLVVVAFVATRSHTERA